MGSAGGEQYIGDHHAKRDGRRDCHEQVKKYKNSSPQGPRDKKAGNEPSHPEDYRRNKNQKKENTAHVPDVLEPASWLWAILCEVSRMHSNFVGNVEYPTANPRPSESTNSPRVMK